MSSIEITPKAFDSTRFAPLTHSLADHPGFALPALQTLARRLAATGQARFITPGATQRSEFYHFAAPDDGRALDAAFESIERPAPGLRSTTLKPTPAARR